MIFILRLREVNVDGTINSTPSLGTDYMTLSVFVNGLPVFNSTDLVADEATIDADTPIITVGSLNCRLTNLSLISGIAITGQAIQTVANPGESFDLRVVINRYDSSDVSKYFYDQTFKLNQYNATIDLYPHYYGATPQLFFFTQSDVYTNSFKYSLTSGINGAEVDIIRNGTIIAEGTNGTLPLFYEDYEVSLNYGGDLFTGILVVPKKRIVPNINLALFSSISYEEIQYVEDTSITVQTEMDFSNVVTLQYDATSRLRGLKSYSIQYQLYRDNGTLINTYNVAATDIWETASPSPTGTEVTITLPDTTSNYYLLSTVSFRNWNDVIIFTAKTSESLQVQASIGTQRNCNEITVLNGLISDVNYSIDILLPNKTWSQLVEPTELLSEDTFTYKASKDGVYKITFDDGISAYSKIVIADCNLQTCLVNASKDIITFKPCQCKCKEDVINLKFNYISAKIAYDTYMSILRVVKLDTTYTTYDDDLMKKLVDVVCLIEDILSYCNLCSQANTEDCGC